VSFESLMEAGQA